MQHWPSLFWKLPISCQAEHLSIRFKATLTCQISKNFFLPNWATHSLLRSCKLDLYLCMWSPLLNCSSSPWPKKYSLHSCGLRDKKGFRKRIPSFARYQETRRFPWTCAVNLKRAIPSGSTFAASWRDRRTNKQMGVGSLYPPWNQHGTWNARAGTWVSFWEVRCYVSFR